MRLLLHVRGDAEVIAEGRHGGDVRISSCETKQDAGVVSSGMGEDGVFKIYEPHETAAPGAGDSAAIGCDGIGWHHFTSSNFWSLLGKSSYPDPSIRRHRPRQARARLALLWRWVPVQL